ncbi:S24 family peptidase [Sphingomonas cannabina]|uniref:S24 family peptidase n=1 Tax=Sphingomonas cannabina TaxID=2899123 RepID=UPI001F198B30|nr:S24 family peptidase [Sphingomonas cannabina]UIJ46941.1 S24 family peptidase [Sphingomonas cannabina]
MIGAPSFPERQKSAIFAISQARLLETGKSRRAITDFRGFQQRCNGRTGKSNWKAGHKLRKAAVRRSKPAVFGRFRLTSSRLIPPNPARFVSIDLLSRHIVTVPRIEVSAAAGAGQLVDGEAMRPTRYPAEELARMGVRPEDASEITVSGDSMAPTLHDGDRILVDRGQRRPGTRAAIWVIRVDEALRVKRLAGEGRRWRIVSDNPDWPEDLRDKAEVEVLGRVVRLTREF